MKFGLMFANVGPSVEPDGLVHLAGPAEFVGFECALDRRAHRRAEGLPGRSIRTPRRPDPGADDSRFPIRCRLAYAAAVTTKIKPRPASSSCPSAIPSTSRRKRRPSMCSRAGGGPRVGIGWLEDRARRRGTLRSRPRNKISITIHKLWQGSAPRPRCAWSSVGRNRGAGPGAHSDHDAAARKDSGAACRPRRRRAFFRPIRMRYECCVELKARCAELAGSASRVTTLSAKVAGRTAEGHRCHSHHVQVYLVQRRHHEGSFSRSSERIVGELLDAVLDVIGAWQGRLPTTLFEDVTLTLRRGEKVGLVGRDGAGGRPRRSARRDAALRWSASGAHHGLIECLAQPSSIRRTIREVVLEGLAMECGARALRQLMNGSASATTQRETAAPRGGAGSARRRRRAARLGAWARGARDHDDLRPRGTEAADRDPRRTAACHPGALFVAKPRSSRCPRRPDDRLDIDTDRMARPPGRRFPLADPADGPRPPRPRRRHDADPKLHNGLPTTATTKLSDVLHRRSSAEAL